MFDQFLLIVQQTCIKLVEGNFKLAAASYTTLNGKNFLIITTKYE